MTWIQSLKRCFSAPIRSWKRGRNIRRYTIGLITVPLHILFNLWVFVITEVAILGLAWAVYHVVFLVGFLLSILYHVAFERKTSSVSEIAKEFFKAYQGFNVRRELRRPQ